MSSEITNFSLFYIFSTFQDILFGDLKLDLAWKWFHNMNDWVTISLIQSIWDIQEQESTEIRHRVLRVVWDVTSQNPRQYRRIF